MTPKFCAPLLITLVGQLAPKSHTRGSHVQTAQLSHVQFANRQVDPTAVINFLSDCSLLPDQYCQYITKARQIADIFIDTPELEPSTNTAKPDSDPEDHKAGVNARVFRVQTRQSPYPEVFHSHHSVRITIDSGAIGNMVRSALVQRLGCFVTRISQWVHQADGSSPMNVVGETRLTFTRESHEFTFEGQLPFKRQTRWRTGLPSSQHVSGWSFE